MKSIVKFMVRLAVVMVVVGVATYMFDAVRTKQQVEQLNNATSKSEPVITHDEYMEHFMSGCDTEDNFSGERFDQKAYCKCVALALEERYGVNNLIKTILNRPEKELEEIMYPVAQDCIEMQGIEI